MWAFLLQLGSKFIVTCFGWVIPPSAPWLLFLCLHLYGWPMRSHPIPSLRWCFSFSSLWWVPWWIDGWYSTIFQWHNLYFWVIFPGELMDVLHDFQSHNLYFWFIFPWRIDGWYSTIFNHLITAFLFVIPGNFIFVCGSVICFWKMVWFMVTKFWSSMSGLHSWGVSTDIPKFKHHDWWLRGLSNLLTNFLPVYRWSWAQLMRWSGLGSPVLDNDKTQQLDAPFPANFVPPPWHFPFIP